MFVRLHPFTDEWSRTCVHTCKEKPKIVQISLKKTQYPSPAEPVSRLPERRSVRASVLERVPRLFLALTAFLLIGSNVAHAYPNEVYLTGGTYRWKINNVEIGSTADLATAVSNCIWQASGVRDVHLLVGGNLSSTISLQTGVRIYGHNNNFTRSHGGTGFHHEGAGDIHVNDLNITSGGGWGIHMSRASNLRFVNIKVLSGGIGIRVDSHPSRPYEAGRWVYNVYVQDCTFENLGSHGLETYGVDGFSVYGIIARNNGECGVLINKGYNGTIGTVDAYRCSLGGGYAGLRFANDCANVTVNKLVANECGRGFFTVTGAVNITVNEVYIRNSTNHAILLQNSDNVRINSGSFSGDGLNHYTSVNCQINAVPVGLRRITNFAGGRSLDVNGNADGSPVILYDYLGGANQKWNIADVGGARYSIRTSQSGGRALDSSWNPANGTASYVWSYLNNSPQKWEIQSVGNSRFRLNSNINLTQCLDAAGTGNGSTVLMYSYWGGSNQQWSIVNP